MGLKKLREKVKKQQEIVGETVCMFLSKVSYMFIVYYICNIYVFLWMYAYNSFHLKLRVPLFKCALNVVNNKKNCEIMICKRWLFLVAFL